MVFLQPVNCIHLENGNQTLLRTLYRWHLLREVSMRYLQCCLLICNMLIL